MTDCTEPNRANCPRHCVDFCNAAEIRKFNAELVKNQKVLPADMQKVLYDNLWDLYAK